MDAELTAGYAGQPGSVAYLVDLVLAKFVNAGQVADITAMVDAEDYAAEKAAMAPIHLGRDEYRRQDLRRRRFGRRLRHLLQRRPTRGGRDHRVPADARRLVEAAKALTTDQVWGFSVRDSFPDYGHWDWLPYVHNDDGDVMTADLTAQNLDPNAASATQYLADMKVVHKVSPEAGAYQWKTGNWPLFEAGRIAILHDEFPQAVVWEVDKPVDFRLGVAQAPATTEGGKQTTMGNFGYATISEKSPNKEAAWEVVKWWTSAEVINPYAAQIGLQPSHRLQPDVPG